MIENLRPVDYVGVLIFDNSFQWAVPIRRAEDRSTIKRLVAGITPDGGTQIAPALAEAYRRIQKSTATYRHIVLLTDGISEEGDSMALAKEARGHAITISTVGLGQDVNRAYLEKIAVNAKGNSYFLTDPSGLEQILLKDVMEHTGSTAVEKPIVPVVIEAVGDSGRRAAGVRAASSRLCEVHRQARRGHDSQRRQEGSAARRLAVRAWAAPLFSPPTPRAAGRRTGSLGRASTSSG